MQQREEPGASLHPPAAFRAPRPSGSSGLIPPSHFQSRSAPPLAAAGAAPWEARPPSWQTQELAELRQENQRLRDELQRWMAAGARGRATVETEEPRARTRSLDREAEPPAAHHALAMSQQAELISHQLQEIRRLEAELTRLRAATLQLEAQAAARESTVTCLQGELEQLRGRSQAEGEALRAELVEQRRRGQAEADALRVELDELRQHGQGEADALRAELEERRRRGQAEADALRAELEVAAERHQRELAAARGELRAVLVEGEAQTQRATEQLQGVLGELQAELSRLRQSHGAEVGSLRQQALQLEQELEASSRERQSLQEQLSAARAELASQQALLQQLRTYVGKQGSEPGSERQQLLDQVQHLEGERRALQTTVQLLQLRLAALRDILALQELELSGKPEPAQKGRVLLSRWREKVFALMVQLRSQELGHADATRLLHGQVAELQEEAQLREQKAALLLHSLQDKAAEADLERVAKERLQAELSRQEDSGHQLQRRVAAAEGALQGLAELVTRLHQQLGGQEAELKVAVARLAGLGNRVTFAAKRVDTIQGLVLHKVALAQLQRKEQPQATRSEDDDGLSQAAVRAELALLQQERDRLAAELKRGAQTLAQQVAEARERAEQELREAVRGLQEALEQVAAAEQEQQRLQGRLEEAERQRQESQEAAEAASREAAGLRQEYERALQEKVAEVETRLRGDLAELEKRLSEAQREHTKAVVALRQAERQATRDKARAQELARLQEEARQEESSRLRVRLQALERDKNLLMATLRQEGLLAQYRQNRLAARHDPARSEQPAPGEGGAGLPSKGALAAVLEELQTLSAALLREEEEEEEEAAAAAEEGRAAPGAGLQGQGANKAIRDPAARGARAFPVNFGQSAASRAPRLCAGPPNQREAAQPRANRQQRPRPLSPARPISGEATGSARRTGAQAAAAALSGGQRVPATSSVVPVTKDSGILYYVIGGPPPSYQGDRRSGPLSAEIPVAKETGF
ncbi:LOW QUALITY PROTEIN: coiled-coil alpha-helical rod protein 1 [Carettochelys insculpta]|uniref:LOW QUALITY PROTEIN: coiled-coil alpha-helical rod protein 1 n=1 Tax=Carettochelys insculpta TaxID=44489 RepID=UPI003EBD6FCC